MTQTLVIWAVVRVIEQGFGEVIDRRLWPLFPQQPVAGVEQWPAADAQQLPGPQLPRLRLGQRPAPFAIQAGPQGQAQQVRRAAEQLQRRHEPAEQRQAHRFEIGPRIAAGHHHGPCIPRPQPHLGSKIGRAHV